VEIGEIKQFFRIVSIGMFPVNLTDEIYRLPLVSSLPSNSEPWSKYYCIWLESISVISLMVLQSKVVATTSRVSRTWWCTFYAVVFHGRASRLQPRSRNTNGLAKRKCQRPSKNFARDFHVGLVLFTDNRISPCRYNMQNGFRFDRPEPSRMKRSCHSFITRHPINSSIYYESFRSFIPLLRVNSFTHLG